MPAIPTILSVLFVPIALVALLAATTSPGEHVGVGTRFLLLAALLSSLFAGPVEYVRAKDYAKHVFPRNP